MSDLTLELSEIKAKESELQMLVDASGKAELAQCVRLLSIYIAIYKKQFGELSADSYEKILASEEITDETAKIFENGVHEAIAILDMVLQIVPEDNYLPEGVTIN